MKLSEICVDRPVLASVMSLVIVLFGALALARLSNRELPDVDEPVVAVTTVYPGAAPEVVETSVTEPLEDQLIGIEGVRHLVSQSREQVSTITVQFELGRDIEAAANDVRDRVARSRSDAPRRGRGARSSRSATATPTPSCGSRCRATPTRSSSCPASSSPA